MTLPDLDRARVLVAGDVMLDRYWHGATSRVSPEAPVPVVHVNAAEDRPGGAANVALNVAALGGAATLLGVRGNDEAGRAVAERVAAAGVRGDWQVEPTYPTVTKLRVLSRHQQLLRLDFEAPGAPIDGSGFERRFRTHLSDSGVVLLSDYAKGALAGVAGLIAAAREAGKPVVVDPKGRDFGRYAGATVLTPNLSELEGVLGAWAAEADLTARVAALLADLGLEALLLTRGEHGMTLFRRDRSPLHLPAEAREVFDVTGAGDTVVAALATVLAAGETLESAVALANRAAGLAVGKLGTATVTQAELRRALGEDGAPARGVLPEDRLLEALAAARARGERVVMTNGCFDLLHAGHVGYLREARALGDRLVVAVNDDASVRRLKGADRPVVPLEERMAVLAALEAVDWVVPFSEDTPARLIARVSPDVLVKGGDYRPEAIAGADHVTAAGGEVVVLDYREGCSTSGILARVRTTGPDTPEG